MKEDKLVSVLTDKSSAPDALTQMIHCNCLEGCNTPKVYLQKAWTITKVYQCMQTL